MQPLRIPSISSPILSSDSDARILRIRKISEVPMALVCLPHTQYDRNFSQDTLSSYLPMSIISIRLIEKVSSTIKNSRWPG